MRRHATTILLVVLAIALGSWVYLDRRGQTDAERTKRENSVFVAWRREDVTRIAVEHDAESLVLERGATWRMTSPRVAPVDPAAVDRLVLDLELATIARKVVPGDDLGFSPPRAHGSITIGTKTHTFALGGVSPRPEGSAYFRVDDEAPVVVNKELASALLAGSDTYRDRVLVPYFENDLASLEVAGEYRLALQDGTFRRDGRLVARDALDKVWNGLALLKAEAFPRVDDVPDASLRVRLVPRKQGSPPAEFVLGGSCPAHEHDVLVLRTAPTRELACAPEAVLDALRPAPEVLRGPFAARVDEIDEVRLEGDRTFDFARKGTGFVMRAPEARALTRAESDEVSDLLERIALVKGVVTPKEPFTAKGRVRIHAGEHEEIVEIGAMLHRLADDAFIEVSPEALALMTARETILRPRVLLGETRRPTRIALRCGIAQDLVDDGKGLRLVSPMNGSVPYDTDGAVVDLANALLRRNVDAWIADESTIASDACHVTIAFEDGKEPITVRFSATSEGCFGDVAGRPGEFVAPPSLCELVRGIYVSRSLNLDLGRATVTTGAAKHAVAPGGLEVLGRLFAERVVDLKAQGGFATIVIEGTGEGGVTRARLSCAPIPRWGDPMLACRVPGVAATYEVRASALDTVMHTD